MDHDGDALSENHTPIRPTLSKLPAKKATKTGAPPKISQLTDTQKEILIGLVQNYPWLYDIKHKDKRDTVKCNNSWHEINMNLQQIVEEGVVVDAKREWTRLRQDYMKNKLRHTTRSGQAAVSVPHWKYYDQMKFIDAVDADDKDKPPLDNYGNGNFELLDQSSASVILEDTQQPMTDENDGRFEYLDDDMEDLASLAGSGFVEPVGSRSLSSRPVSESGSAQNSPVVSPTPTVAANPVQPRRKKTGAPPVSKSRSNQNMAIFQQTLNEIASKLVSDQTAEDHFGSTVAELLKALPKQQRPARMKKIMDILTEPSVDEATD